MTHLLHLLTDEELIDLLHRRYSSKAEEHFVEWCAEWTAKAFVHEHPDLTAGQTVEDLKAEALADPTFTAKARARFRYETFDAMKEQGHG
jgi:hypothetical protein